MHKLTLDEYSAQKIKNGVYIYYSPGCFTCEHHINNFKKFMNDFFVIDTMENPEYFENDDVKITPLTRIFKNNKNVYEKVGALYESQLQEMKGYL